MSVVSGRFSPPDFWPGEDPWLAADGFHVLRHVVATVVLLAIAAVATWLVLFQPGPGAGPGRGGMHPIGVTPTVEQSDPTPADVS